MSLDIDHYPSPVIFMPFPFLPQIQIDISFSVQEKLEKNQQLTNALAIKIFKQIKLKSDVLSFLTRPLVLTVLSISLLATGCALLRNGVAMTAVSLMLCILAGSMLGLCLHDLQYSSFLSALSEGYKLQSKRAAEHIDTIQKATQELEFRFPDAAVL